MFILYIIICIYICKVTSFEIRIMQFKRKSVFNQLNLDMSGCKGGIVAVSNINPTRTHGSLSVEIYIWHIIIHTSPKSSLCVWPYMWRTIRSEYCIMRSLNQAAKSFKVSRPSGICPIRITFSLFCLAIWKVFSIHVTISRYSGVASVKSAKKFWVYLEEYTGASI